MRKIRRAWGGAEAEVRAEAEGEVGIGLSVEADFFGRRENGLVEIGGGPGERDAFAGFHGGAVDGGVGGAHAADVGERHEDPEKLFARERDALRVGAEVIQRLGVFGEMAEGAGDGVDDGVAAAGEGEVGEAYHLVARERSSAVGGLRERAEKIGTEVGLGFVEFAVQVVFEDRAGFEFAAGDLENVDAPAEPDLALAGRDVEQVGEGARLHGQGELVDDLDGVARERLVEQVGDQGLDLRDDGGVFGAGEKRFDDRAVVAVLGRVGLDGQLAHRAHGFLGGNRHAERRVGAERLPVLRGLAHVLVAEEHRDVLAVKRAFEDAGFLAGLAQRVGESRHGEGERSERGPLAAGSFLENNVAPGSGDAT